MTLLESYTELHSIMCLSVGSDDTLPAEARETFNRLWCRGALDMLRLLEKARRTVTSAADFARELAELTETLSQRESSFMQEAFADMMRANPEQAFNLIKQAMERTQRGGR